MVRAFSLGLAEAEKGKCRCSLNIRVKEMLSKLMEGPNCSLTALEDSRVSFVKEGETKQVLFPLQMLLSCQLGCRRSGTSCPRRDGSSVGPRDEAAVVRVAGERWYP